MLDSVFEGQVALFTASTSGIGLASAELCARHGARVIVLNGRNVEAGAKAVERVRAVARAGTTVEFIAADLTDAEAAGALCEEVLRRHARLDVFIHGGGAEISPRLFVDIDPQHYRPLIDGHFTALLHCCRVVAPAMVRQGSGSIVAIASDAGKVATPGETVIGAMKAATIMYVRTLALELSRHNVRVNCVAPSLVVDTKAHDRVMASEFSSRIFEKASRRARLGVPNPMEVATTAVFLASPLSSRTTGQAVSVNGGISAA
jgi:3-oxoacyl-[acyl-carrier protein] reductase